MRSSISLLLLSFFMVQLTMAQQAGSGYALDLNGTSDHVEIPNATALNPTTAFTVEAWINASSWATSSWQNTIVSKDTWSSISEGWVLRCGANGTLNFNLALNNTNAWYEVTSSPVMQTNKWYHVAGTYDGTTLTIYINGVQSGTFTQAGTITATTASVKIGNIARPATSRFFDGQIDEVRLWSQALTQNEIRANMCQKVTSTHPHYAKLIAYYNLDAGTGSVVADLSGNGHNGTNYGSAWVTSGAAIGDESTYLYTSPWLGKVLKIGHANGDSVLITGVTGGPGGMHLYRVDSVPNVANPPAGVAYFYDERYWGVFPTSGSSVNCAFAYNYAGYPGITNQGALNLSHRTGNDATTWNGIVSTLDSNNQTIGKLSTPVGEYILGRNDNLTDFNLVSPVSASTFTIQGMATQTLTFDWRQAKLVSGTVTYKWLLDKNTGNFTAPLLNKNSASSGTDTLITVTYQELANMMNANSIFYDDVLNGKWTAQATGGPIQKQALLPFDIDIKRGILNTDKIFQFFINTPDQDTLTVYNNGTQTIDFEWMPATSSAGPVENYEVQITGFSGNFNAPLGTFQANNGGLDEKASITHADLATMLANVPIANDQVFQFKWRTVASLGSLTQASVDSQYIWIVRRDDPFIGVKGGSEERGNRVYPNPASKSLKFEMPAYVGQSGTLYLGDINGKLIKKQPITVRETNQLDVSDVSPGVYLLEVLIGTTMIEMKVMVE